MKIETTSITGWKIASKTKPIKARFLSQIVDTRSLIFDKLLLSTLEGNEPLRPEAMVCIGGAGDVWMQTLDKLQKKYTRTAVDVNGWGTYEPIPDNAVDCFEVPDSLCEPDSHNTNVFYIIGQWGETITVDQSIVKNVQRGVAGDFICRNQIDTTDVWIVKRSLFLNTYVVKS